MKKQQETKWKEIYRKGMSRLEASSSFQKRILDAMDENKQQGSKWRTSRVAPLICTCACLLCLIVLSFSLLPLLQQSLVAEKPEKAEESDTQSFTASFTEEKRFLLIRMEENDGILTGTLLSEPPVSEGIALPSEQIGVPLPPEDLRAVLLQSGFSGILVVTSKEGMTAEATQHASHFLSDLDSSSRFTVLPLFQSFQSETEDTLWAWAQVALTHFLRSEERILLSEGSCSVLSYPLLEGPYPLCGSFGLPEEDGSFYTGTAYTTAEGETLFSPSAGTVIYSEEGAVVVYAEGFLIAVSGMKTAFCEKEDSVTAGEPLGETAEGTVYLSVLSGSGFVDPSPSLLKASYD